MFVDASAIVAILTLEPEAGALADALEAVREPITSAIAIFEAVAGICRKRGARVADAQDDVRAFLSLAGVKIVAISEREAETALAAFDRFGKGRGKPSHLTVNNCVKRMI